jgi:hypothetical protein
MTEQPELRRAIVKGQVADYAKVVAENNRVSDEMLKNILIEIAELL